jgi:UDPglucose 6-dehydrogenase
VLCEDQYAALVGADALVVVTEWKSFKMPDFEAVRAALKEPVIFDGRNLYDLAVARRHGIVVLGSGKELRSLSSGEPRLERSTLGNNSSMPSR